MLNTSNTNNIYIYGYATGTDRTVIGTMPTHHVYYYILLSWYSLESVL